LIFRARRREELRASARYTADHPDAEAEARFLAFRKDVEQGESRMFDAGDEQDGPAGDKD